jgi:hypothetical protein
MVLPGFRGRSFEGGKGSLGTVFIPGKGWTTPNARTAQTGEVSGGEFSRNSAADAGGTAILIRLPAFTDNTSVSRGHNVFNDVNAMGISRANGGIPVFLQAPRGSAGSVLAVEFTGTNSVPAGRVEALNFR